MLCNITQDGSWRKACDRPFRGWLVDPGWPG